MITTKAQGLFTPRANLRCETVQDEDYASRVAQQIILAGFLVIVEPLGNDEFNIYTRDDFREDLFRDALREAL